MRILKAIFYELHDINALLRALNKKTADIEECLNNQRLERIEYMKKREEQMRKKFTYSVKQ